MNYLSQPEWEAICDKVNFLPNTAQRLPYYIAATTEDYLFTNILLVGELQTEISFASLLEDVFHNEILTYSGVMKLQPSFVKNISIQDSITRFNDYINIPVKEYDFLNVLIPMSSLEKRQFALDFSRYLLSMRTKEDRAVFFKDFIFAPLLNINTPSSWVMQRLTYEYFNLYCPTSSVIGWWETYLKSIQNQVEKVSIGITSVFNMMASPVITRGKMFSYINENATLIELHDLFTSSLTQKYNSKVDLVRQAITCRP